MLSLNNIRYPVPVTLFLVGILGLITLLILGVVRHWPLRRTKLKVDQVTPVGS